MLINKFFIFIFFLQLFDRRKKQVVKRKSKRVLKLWEDITPEMMTEEETGSDNKFVRHRQSWRTRKFNRFMDRIDNYKTSTSSSGKQRVLGNEIDRLAPVSAKQWMLQEIQVDNPSQQQEELTSELSCASSDDD